jgi:hypothetical protein
VSNTGRVLNGQMMYVIDDEHKYLLRVLIATNLK